MLNLSKEEFLQANHLSLDSFDRIKINWEELLAIGIHHKNQDRDLSITAAHIASRLQLNSFTHSVRWRIKDPEHLMAKIVRKQLQNTHKYAEINVHNYDSIITDLIGIRVLHLFKDDALSLDKQIRDKYDLFEQPIYFYKLGDDLSFIPEGIFEKKAHDIGYRSIHYIIQAGDKDDRKWAEIQVRTLFEEGWSEIDHLIRYPSFSNDPDIEYFLKLFNDAASFADEMGNSIRVVKKIKEEKEQRAQKMINQLIEMKESIESSDERMMAHISKLESETKNSEMIENFKTFFEDLKVLRAQYVTGLLELHEINWTNNYYQVDNEVKTDKTIKGNPVISLCKKCINQYRIISVGGETNQPCYHCGCNPT